MGGHRLRVRGEPVPEEPPRERTHLEETEVLPVLRGWPQARLTPGDVDRLPAVVAEHTANRVPGRRGVGASLHSRTLERANLPDLPCGRREPRLGARKRLPCDNSVPSRMQKRPVRLEETDRASCLTGDGQLSLEATRQRGVMPDLRRSYSCSRSLVQLRCRSGLCDHNERAQANEYGSQNVFPPDRGQGRGQPRRPSRVEWAPSFMSACAVSV